MSTRRLAIVWLIVSLCLGSLALAWGPVFRPAIFARLPAQGEALSGWLSLDGKGRDWWGREVRYFEFGAISAGRDGVFQTPPKTRSPLQSLRGDDVGFRSPPINAATNLLPATEIYWLYCAGSGAAWLGFLCAWFTAMSKRRPAPELPLGGRSFLAECAAGAIAITFVFELIGRWVYPIRAIGGATHVSLWLTPLLGATVAAALYSLAAKAESLNERPPSE